jgi:uncharacterized protein YbbK (DUF523 family)
MPRYSERRVRALVELELDGYVLKRASPSCGLFRVRVYHALLMEAFVVRSTRGRHANVLQHLAGYFRSATSRRTTGPSWSRRSTSAGAASCHSSCR